MYSIQKVVAKPLAFNALGSGDTHRCTHMHTCTYSHRHRHRHTDTHTQTHTHKHTHIHTHPVLSFHCPAWVIWPSKKGRDRNSKSKPSHYQGTFGFITVVMAQPKRIQRNSVNLEAACTLA